MPHSSDREYAERSIPQYERAVELAGGEPVRIPLDQSPSQAMNIIERCDGVLLPGSGADVDPSKFNAVRSLRTAAPDRGREAVDELLLQDAYDKRKPVLGICYGLQSLNVHRAGSLIQHIPDFLPEDLRARVNHEAGKTIAIAHTVKIERDSKLGKIVNGKDREGHGVSDANKTTEKSGTLASEGNTLVVPVNSSHHQSADGIGEGLRIVARCSEDGIIEALEGIDPDHFVLAVQWHPERSVDDDAPSRAIFQALIAAAQTRHSKLNASPFSVLSSELS
jgi:putative glutamine amidotransferase